MADAKKASAFIDNGGIMNREVKSLPMVALRGLTIVPEMVIHFDVSRERSITAVNEAMQEEGQKIFLSAQKDPYMEEPVLEDIYLTGTVATIKQIVKLPKNVIRVLVTGDQRARINALEFTEPYLRANVTILEEENDIEDSFQTDAYVNMEGMARGLKELYTDFVSKNPKYPKDMVKQINGYTQLDKIIRAVMANIPLDYPKLQQLLEEDSMLKRYNMLTTEIINEMQIIRIKDEIQAKVKEKVDKHQKEYVLREELKVIREELGEDQTISEAEEFMELCEKLDASEKIKEKIRKEIRRFKSSVNSPAENGVLRNYIETMLDMPWNKCSQDKEDMEFASKLLEEEHYGLEKVKERILEYLAVRILTKKGESPILCLVGPPGTGKTSIARSLAKALNKEYVRISLGGVRDEAEIRGHRKTYVGAMPGRIAAGLKQAGVKNPLLLLDEIDKVSSDYKGDTFSALLEVLDGEQNVKFRDHYLEVPVDLSEVLFVTTANTLQTIPKPLLDRMEVIQISSYTENEKIHIATDHLIPKQLKKHGLSEEQLRISKGATAKMARNYTREAGVRQLERTIGDLCRKTAREILEKNKKQVRITESNLSKYLGKELFTYQPANEKDEVGIVRGLAWTSVGGDTLQIEVNVMPGKGELLLTGQMGDVMKESGRIGISYIRSLGEAYHIPEHYFEEHDIHLHIPEGAVPKDGPSAGITMATAILSAVTDRKIKASVAMTGEITLRGRVLPVGGLKEKLLAAKNAGIKTVIVPKENEKNVMELPAEITKGMEILFLSHMTEVLEHVWSNDTTAERK